MQTRFITAKRGDFIAWNLHHRLILEEADNTNNLHAFNWFEEEGFVDVDFAQDALYALTTTTIQD